MKVLLRSIQVLRLGPRRFFCNEVVARSDQLALVRGRLEHFQRELEERVDVEKHKAERQLAHSQPFTTRVKDDVRFYYNGFKGFLLELVELNKLLSKMLREKKPIDRETHLKVERIKTDSIKLIPASIIVALPFTAVILPFFFKFFPHFLPSSFIEPWREVELNRKLTQIRVEMANQLEESLQINVESSRHLSPQKRQQQEKLVELISQMRSKAERLEVVSAEDIQKYLEFGKVNVQLLGSFTQPQLKCLSRIFEAGLIFKWPQLIRVMLLRHFRKIYADDVLISKEGLDQLSFHQLRSACIARGLQGFQLTEAELKTQLARWLQLSTDIGFPRSFLAVGTISFWPRRELSDADWLRITLAPVERSHPQLLASVEDMSDQSSLELKLSTVKRLLTDIN